ncbi:MAG: chromate transporter [Eubacterium sp.]|nr:chromate transporter [Eubacterium sp.]
MNEFFLFTLFFKIGAFSFGGGLAMLPIIFQSVAQYDLISQSDFANLVAISQVTPGPMVVNAATFLGYNCCGFTGAAAATLGVAVPSFAVVVLALHFLEKYKDNRVVDSVMKAIKPATVGLVAAGVIFLAKEVEVSLIPIGICIATVIMSGKFKINPIYIIIIMAVLGGLLC